jgi:hypothetical protein
MIDRIEFVRLKKDHRTEEKRAGLASCSETTLQAIPMVRSVRVATAVDDKTQQEWDMLLTIRLDAVEDLETSRLDPVHRKYVDDYLKPRASQIKGWNFS